MEERRTIYVNETVWQHCKRSVKEKATKAYRWCGEHKGFVILAAPFVLKAGSNLVGAIGKNINLSKQEDIKNLYCYDKSLGHYWALKRELTNDEWLYVDRQRRAGEKLSDIFDRMKVLK